MASKASSSATAVNPLNPLDLPPIATLGKSLIISGDVMKFNFCLLKLRSEHLSFFF
ncbi:hypothetical protein A2U01_0092317 [Trifolium medium]|uniref:Uncharacterized protein n=1 Tax=Trifolium medium TaxID=97028 RepID=A0A392UEB3_9FABA|nr:hypothetical protein [Trifolium medium]